MGTVHGLGLAHALVDGEVVTTIVKPVLSPELFQHLNELGREPVALVVLEEGYAQHAKIFLYPTTDDIQTPTPTADLVERGADPGNHTWMEKGSVHGRNNFEPRRHHGQGRSSGERIERRAPEARRPKAGAHALGHEENLQSRLFQNLSYAAVVGERGIRALLSGRNQTERAAGSGGH